jgi:hypothetical protein
MTQANNVAIESSQINSSGVLQPAGGGTGVTTSTGSGNNVLSTSPTLVTPVLGTPTSGTLTNCTGLPVGGITATGTPSSTTYLRGDSTWATVSTSPAGSSGYVQYNNGTTFAGSANLFWDNTNARLGIGTSSPSYPLDITGQGRATTGWAVSTDGSTFTPSGLNAIPNYGVGYITGTSITAFSGFGGNVFYTNQAERMRIDSSGNVGIGTTSTGSKLAVGGNPPGSGIIAGVASSGGRSLALSDNVNNSLYVTHSSGPVLFGTDSGGSIAFATNGSTSSTERMRIDSSGNVFVGGTTQNTATAPVYSSTTAKAWVSFLGGTSPTISSSYNVSSVSYSSTGVWVVNFTSALTDANFVGIANSYYSTYSGVYGNDLVNVRPINSSSAQLNNTLANTAGVRNLGGGNIQAVFFR